MEHHRGQVYLGCRAPCTQRAWSGTSQQSIPSRSPVAPVGSVQDVTLDCSAQLIHVGDMDPRLQLCVRFPVDDEVLTNLHAKAFGGIAGQAAPWAQRLERHSVTWVSAFDGDELRGFVHACWDGGAHALLLDTVVDPAHQRRGIGRRLVQMVASEAAAAGCEWLHVDYEPYLSPFYRQACGFKTTEAGLLRLSG